MPVTMAMSFISSRLVLGRSTRRCAGAAACALNALANERKGSRFWMSSSEKSSSVYTVGPKSIAAATSLAPPSADAFVCAAALARAKTPALLILLIVISTAAGHANGGDQ